MIGHVDCTSVFSKGHRRTHVHGLTSLKPLNPIQPLSPQLHSFSAFLTSHTSPPVFQEMAQAWGVPFEYAALPLRMEEVQAKEIDIRAGEAVAVNCALRLHNLLDETATPSNPRWGLSLHRYWLQPDEFERRTCLLACLPKFDRAGGG